MNVKLKLLAGSTLAALGAMVGGTALAQMVTPAGASRDPPTFADSERYRELKSETVLHEPAVPEPVAGSVEAPDVSPATGPARADVMAPNPASTEVLAPSLATPEVAPPVATSPVIVTGRNEPVSPGANVQWVRGTPRSIASLPIDPQVRDNLIAMVKHPAARDISTPPWIAYDATTGYIGSPLIDSHG